MAARKTVALENKLAKLQTRFDEAVAERDAANDDIVALVQHLRDANSELGALHDYLDQLPGAPPREFKTPEQDTVAPTATARIIGWLANR